MRVSVIIPAWNLWDMTAACLRSLAEHSVGEHIEVLVVDNGSEDATATELEPLGHSLFGTAFKALHLPHNMGFARACNAGATAAAGELLFFLNNDTVCTAGWLTPLRAAFADASVGAAGPLLLYPDGSVQHCGICFGPFGHVEHLYEFFPSDHPALCRERPLQAITGAALMTRRCHFDSCGGFYTAYINGWEDLDFCFSLRNLGLLLRVVPHSQFYHHTSCTPGRFVHESANSRLFLQRWGQHVYPDLHLFAHADGFFMESDAQLHTWLCLSEQRRCALKTFLEKPLDLDRLRALLHQEPLWLDGWLELIGRKEKEGNLQQAMCLCEECIRLFDLPVVRKQMLRLLRMSGRQQALACYLQDLRNVEERQDDAFRYKTRVKAALKKAETREDKLLGEMLQGWLQRYGSL
ncbi:MAG: glycosyltransferase [Desulfovibrio sp.]|nr:glycosyltransferase [Desulfovibrio sp.]